MARNMRKWISLIIAVIFYYIIHEGAHLIISLACETFQSIRFVKWGLGVQIVTDISAMSNVQIFILGIAGAVATLIVSYILVWKRKNILQLSSKFVRAIAYYTTLVFLCLDPLYLSVIYRFVGGGDFNSIVIIGIPEIIAVIFFVILLVLNIIIFIKLIYPSYKQRFLDDALQDATK